MTFDIQSARKDLDEAFVENSEVKLLKILKNNSFMFYFLYSRRYGIQPNFKEISFGGNYRCDFCWLNDNSDGPEWVLVEIEKPRMKLFTAKKEPSAELNHSIEQVKSWKRYFKNNPSEKRRIFGAVARFRYILVAGCKDDWEKKHAALWRVDHNEDSKIEIRSSNIFYRSLEFYTNHPDEFWSFENNPKSLSKKDLQPFCKNDPIINNYRNILN
ncbi:Shedu protein SduA C-terminal domain-containing protein [Candidatus Electrothrix aarhusensis]